MHFKKSWIFLIVFLISLSFAQAHVCGDVRTPGNPQYLPGCDPIILTARDAAQNGNLVTLVINFENRQTPYAPATSCVNPWSSTLSNADITSVSSTPSCSSCFSMNNPTAFSIPINSNHDFNINVTINSGATPGIYNLTFGARADGISVTKYVVVEGIEVTASGCTLDSQCSAPTPYCNTSTGTCVACLSASHCNDNNECTTDSCLGNVCSNSNITGGTACTGGNCCLGTCDTSVGNSNFHIDCRTGPQCVGASWEYVAANNGGSCGTGGTCSAGICTTPSGCTSDLNCTSLSGSCGTGRCNSTSGSCYASYNSSANICRNNVSECDAAEFCTGNNASCPANINKTDGSICSGGTCIAGTCIATVPLNGYLNISAESASYYTGDEIKLTGLTLQGLSSLSFWEVLKDFFRGIFGITGQATFSSFGGSNLRPSLINNTGPNPITGYLLIKTLKASTSQDYSIVVNETSPRTINARTSFALKDVWPTYKIDEAGNYILYSEFRDASGRVIRTSEAYLNDSFEFEVKPSGGGGDSGGGSSGGGGSSIGSGNRAANYTLTDTQLSAGYTKAFGKGDRIEFYIGSQVYYITIDSINNNLIKINLTFAQNQATITTGQENQFDINDDGIYDLTIKSNNISSGKVSMTLKKIYARANEASNANEANSPTNLSDGEKPVERKNSRIWLWIIIGVIAILIFAVIIILVVYKIRKSRLQQVPSSDNPIENLCL